MDIIDLIILGIIIALNNLSFALGYGAIGDRKYHLRIVLVFTIVEFTIPLIGLLIGSYVSQFIDDYSQILGSLILVGLGIYTIYTAFKSKTKNDEVIKYISSFKVLFLIALGLSIDNLLVGFSLGLNKVKPLVLASIIAFFSMLFTFIGLKTGRFLKVNFGKYIQLITGVFLIGLGVFSYFDISF